MSIRDLLEPGRVLSNVEARSKKHALEILSELLATSEHDITAGEIFDCLVSRERLGSTGLGESIALPHGRAPGLDEPVGAFLKLSEGVDFEASDGEPVRLVFGILVPEDAHEQHLQTLSEIARRFLEPDFRARLLETTSSRTLYELLVESEGDAEGGAEQPGTPGEPAADSEDSG